jgi:predicted amidophosphoribosyltransferase
MLALSKCALCGKAFNSVGSRLCAPCMKQLDEAYVKVRRFIYQNPDKAAFASIVEGAQVEEETLSYLIDQGRIVIGGTAGGGTRCRACGAVTAGDALCERCRSRLVSEKLMPGAAGAGGEPPGRAGRKVQPLHTQKF